MKQGIAIAMLLTSMIIGAQEKVTTVSYETINLETANELINDALRRADKKGFSVVAAVVDRNGTLIALKRMDGSAVGPLDVAMKKAKTAALFQMNSLAFGTLAQPGAPIYTIENTNGGMISFGGGVKLLHNGHVIGALGVAGATVEEDDIIAKNVIKSFQLDK